MKNTQPIFICIALISLFISPLHASEKGNENVWQPFGFSLLRYEVDENFINNSYRERMRLIARAGLKIQATPKVSATFRAATGLKNKQNVPAITIYKFTEQPQPSNDVYIDQAYLTYKSDKVRARVGRQPWVIENISDTFWDRDLNPYAITYRYEHTNNQTATFAALLPLDGQSATVGRMLLAQYSHVFSFNSVQVMLSPWFVDYQGEDNAMFARQDTQFDHRSVRLSAAAKWQKWQLGVDLGHAINAEDKENSSMTTELKYGGLKEAGAWLWHARYYHVERFAVITEFAQNALSPGNTSNISAWDVRIRHALSKKLWLGARLSRVKSLVGTTKSTNRFRIEMRYTFK